MWEEGFVNYCAAHDTVGEWGVECPVCATERDNQRRINAEKRAAQSERDTAEAAARDMLFSENISINERLSHE